ncbi:MAG TPA: ammonium transporter, partial [Candidatus Eisenbacteria bacterium]|nr:ammonium transporter [Candidatus Eisenbacteria bacterium]
MAGADIAWVMTSTALVMLMTPALAFFYGGLVRKKNLVS